MSEKQGPPPSYEEPGLNTSGGYTNWSAEQQQQHQQHQQVPPHNQQQQQPQYGGQRQQQYAGQQQPQYGGQQQPYGGQQQPYGQPQFYQQFGNVVVNQPQGTNQIVRPPPDHLGLAVIATLLCCWPIGIMAIMRALDARRAVDRGDLMTATTEAAQARKLSLIAIALGAVILVVTIVVVVVVVTNNTCYYDYYSC